MEETRISKREQLAKSGEIAAFYGKDYFCKVKPAYGIDKVEISLQKRSVISQFLVFRMVRPHLWKE